MSKQKSVVLLTRVELDRNCTGLVERPIIIGVDSIINIDVSNILNSKNNNKFSCTKISSRAAMVTLCYVKESVLEIYDLINS